MTLLPFTSILLTFVLLFAGSNNLLALPSSAIPTENNGNIATLTCPDGAKLSCQWTGSTSGFTNCQVLGTSFKNLSFSVQKMFTICQDKSWATIIYDPRKNSFTAHMATGPKGLPSGPRNRLNPLTYYETLKREGKRIFHYHVEFVAYKVKLSFKLDFENQKVVECNGEAPAVSGGESVGQVNNGLILYEFTDKKVWYNFTVNGSYGYFEFTDTGAFVVGSFDRNDVGQITETYLSI